MTIFKSPARRQSSPNVNVYDTNNFMWVPTAVNHERYRSRFQSTHDLMEARKVFSVFFAADQAQAQAQAQTQTQAQAQAQAQAQTSAQSG